MECKFDRPEKKLVGVSRLIDTLWNVNKRFGTISKQMLRELIDTLWNVNFVHRYPHCPDLR